MSKHLQSVSYTTLLGIFKVKLSKKKKLKHARSNCRLLLDTYNVKNMFASIKKKKKYFNFNLIC